jgi:hypothetical protein
MMTFLARIQTEFQDYVLADKSADSVISLAIADGFGLPVADRLAIYHDAYRLRLAEALSEEFGKTHTYVGDDMFYDLTRSYIAKHPSRYRNLRWYGDAFTAHAAEALAQHPVVAELAAFEWALGLAFDAEDVPVLTVTGLQGLSEDDWEQVSFVLPPSLQLVDFHWNAPGIWLALDKEETPPDAVNSEVATTWLIWRRELQPHFRSLSTHEAQALRGLLAGQSFAEVCAEAADASEQDITDQIAGWLQTWLNEEILSAISHS